MTYKIHPTPVLTTGEVCSRIGVNLTVNTLESLGLKPTVRTEVGVHWLESEFPEICFTIARHINSIGDRAAARSDKVHIGLKDLTQAARDVLAERRRHVDREGWTSEHDDEHAAGTLALAGASYALDAGQTLDLFAPADGEHPEPHFWPFSSDWWKPGNSRRSLVKAAALILAEIERFDRDPGDESGHHHTGGGDHA